MTDLSGLRIVWLAGCLAAAPAVMTACSSSPDRPDRRQAHARRQPDRRPTAPRTSAQELFVQGNAALNDHDYPRAVSLYTQALGRDDGRWDIYMNKAIALSAQQKFSAAIEAIDQALAHGGDQHPALYFNLGNVYQNRGLYEQSIKAYRTSLALADGPDIDTLVNLAAALAFMREYDKATQTYQHLKQLVPDDPRVYHGLGMVEYVRQNRKAALRQYRKANQVDPNFAPTWFNKAAVLADLDRPTAAIESYQHYLALAPDGPYAKRARNRVSGLKAKK